MQQNLAEEIDTLLNRFGHKREDIICVLWGTDRLSEQPDLSIDLESFWKYAEEASWDYEIDWATGPHYPMHLLSGKGWWLEVSEYDSKTSLIYQEELKPKSPTNSLSVDGCIKALVEKKGDVP